MVTTDSAPVRKCSSVTFREERHEPFSAFIHKHTSSLAVELGRLLGNFKVVCIWLIPENLTCHK